MYQSGKVLGPFESNRFIPRVTATDAQAVRMEALLDERRPPKIVSRKAAIFAFDSLARCAAFWDAEHRSGRFRHLYSGEPNYYEVRIEGIHKAPFSLTSRLLSFITQGGGPPLHMVDEYWVPTLPWHVWEYLGRTATVMRRLPNGEEDVFGLMTSDNLKDRDLFDSLKS